MSCKKPTLQHFTWARWFICCIVCPSSRVDFPTKQFMNESFCSSLTSKTYFYWKITNQMIKLQFHHSTSWRRNQIRQKNILCPTLENIAAIITDDRNVMPIHEQGKQDPISPSSLLLSVQYASVFPITELHRLQSCKSESNPQVILEGGDMH